MLVDVLLVVGDEGLGDGLADGVDLGGVATAGDADADVEVGELVEADDEEGLVDLWGYLVSMMTLGWLNRPSPPAAVDALFHAPFSFRCVPS